MKFTTKASKPLLLSAAILMIAGSAMAGNGHGPGDGTGDGTPDRDRDGSCLEVMNVGPGVITLARHNGNRTGDQDGTPDRDRDRDQLKDGSCLDASFNLSTDIILARGGNGGGNGGNGGGGNGDCDGSGGSGGNGAGTGDHDGTPDRDQLRDGSCLDA